MNGAGWEVPPTCCTICPSPLLLLFFFQSSFHSVSFLLTSSTCCPVIFFHPSFAFFAVSLPSSAIFQRSCCHESVCVCSCCFTVSAPLWFHSISRLQIHTVKTVDFSISPPISVVRVMLSWGHCDAGRPRATQPKQTDSNI